MWVPYLLSVLGYLLSALLTARVAYGIERSRLIAQSHDWGSTGDPLRHFEEHGRSATTVLSLVYGLAWPVVVPVFLCCRAASLVVTARPPRSEYERDLRVAARDARIRELEESLGIGGRHPVAREAAERPSTPGRAADLTPRPPSPR